MSFTVDRNNELQDILPRLKQIYQTGTNTTAIYKALDDLVNFYIPEHKRLKEIETKHKEITEMLEQKINLENQLKLAI